ncbi:hypothetical protein E3N88_42983 [Mikania micrantha]|uniref:RNase H type-1 domain-containing protein n=1 Tax=Mikania micrantha TaxID=192012 RepID=A0A5N6LH18_9ASTR|nr:hypothetical protein E3N88_42983 [Mikania micrantha]
MSTSGNTTNRPFSFTFIPTHQTTTTTVIHTGAPATIPVRRRDDEDASSSSSDHTIPRVSVQPTNIALPAIPFSSGEVVVHTPTVPYGIQQRRHTRDKIEVLSLRRGPNETVEGFIVRYNLESLQINETTEAFKVAGFIHGMRDKHLIRKLHRVNGTPEDINSLMIITRLMFSRRSRLRRARNGRTEKVIKKGRITNHNLSRQREKTSSRPAGGLQTQIENWGDIRHIPPGKCLVWLEKGTRSTRLILCSLKRRAKSGGLKGEKAPKEDEKVDGKIVHEIYTIGSKAGSPRCDLKRRVEVLEAWMCIPLTVQASNGCYTEADQAFEDLKRCLEELPALTAPCRGEVLQLYMSASERAGPYPARDKLHHVGKISACASSFFKKVEEILSEISRRLAKWAIEVGVFDLAYKPRTTVKAQVIADFIAEILEGSCGEMERGESNEVHEAWEIYTDGASSTEGAGVGVMAVSPQGKERARALKSKFKASNNEAEYEALIAGLQLVLQENARVMAHVDSLLVANQINGVYEVKEVQMKQYVRVTENLMAKFESCVVIHVPRSQNRKADALSKLASSFKDPVKEISVEEIPAPTTELRMVNVIQEGEVTWMDPIINYLVRGELPEDRMLAHKLRCKAQHYEM